MVQFTMYIEKDTFIHRLDPRTKLLWLVCVFIWSMTFNHPLWTLMILFIVLVFGFASKTLGRFKYFWYGLLSLFLMCSLMWPFFKRGYTVLMYFGPLPLYYESVWFGLAVGIRLVAMVLAGIITFATTRVEDLLAALVKLRFPYSMAFGVSTIFRFIPTMMGDGTLIIAAQEARGVNLRGGSIWEKAKNSVPIMAPLLVTTLRRTGELAMAVEARAFRAKPERTDLYEPRLEAKDVAVMIVSIALTFIFLYLRLQGYGAILPKEM
jgi:energy-coupling factor transport system permease protein